MGARLPAELRSGIVSEALSWFIQCAGQPGTAIEPKTSEAINLGRWPDFANAVIDTAQGTPYYAIGDYMDRWWYMPEIFGERARVHCTRRSDQDRDRHDHPWHFVSVILRTGYTEELEVPNAGGLADRRRFRPGDVLFRHAEHRHRLELDEGTECWSLVFTAPKCREWGFWTPAGFVPWREYSVNA